MEANGFASHGAVDLGEIRGRPEAVVVLEDDAVNGVVLVKHVATLGGP